MSGFLGHLDLDLSRTLHSGRSSLILMPSEASHTWKAEIDFFSLHLQFLWDPLSADASSNTTPSLLLTPLIL